MTNIFDLIDKEDISNLQQLILNEPQQLDITEDDRDFRPISDGTIALDYYETSPLKYAIHHRKPKSVACIINHTRYDLVSGDLFSQSVDIIFFTLKNILQCVYCLHSLNADVISCERFLKASKLILLDLINRFVNDSHQLFQWNIILCDNYEELSKITLSFDKKLNDYFDTKIYGFKLIHLVMLLGDQDVASWVIQQIPLDNLSLLEDSIISDSNFFGYNSLHLAAILNFDRCLRAIADKLNNSVKLLQLLESRPSEISKDGENYSALLLASRANSLASFSVCLELGASIYSIGVYTVLMDDDTDGYEYSSVLDDALSALCAADDDRMLLVIINYLSQRPKSEYYKFIINPQNNYLYLLISKKRIDLAMRMMELGVLLQVGECNLRCDSFEYDGITIYNADLLHMAVLIEDKDLIIKILTSTNRDAVSILLTNTCFYGLVVELDSLNLFILKYFLKLNQNENALFKMSNFKSYQLFSKEVQMPRTAREILDLLLIANVPTNYPCLIQRKKSLAFKIVNDTIHSLFLILQEHNIFNITNELILRLVQSVYLALGFNYTELFEIGSVNTHCRIKEQLPSVRKIDLEVISAKTIFFCAKNTPPYKIAILAFRAWRQNQPLQREDSLARNDLHCRELINLIAIVLKQKWLFVKPMFEQQPQLFIQVFNQQISLIDLRKSEIENVLTNTCQQISGLAANSLIIPTRATESKERYFVARFAVEVLKYFDEERATFRFWDLIKEKDDLIERICNVAIKYISQLQQFSAHLPKRRQLIADLAMSNFAIMEIERIIKRALAETPVTVEKRLHEASDINGHVLPLKLPLASKRVKFG